jgi:small-conductance mechanosensitive channel
MPWLLEIGLITAWSGGAGVTFLNLEFYNNTVMTWLVTTGVAVLIFIGLYALKRIGFGKFARLAQRTKNDLDDLFAEELQQTNTFLLLLLAVYGGSLSLSLSPAVRRAIDMVALLSLLFQVALWGHAIISFWLKQYLKRKIEEDAQTATTVGALGFLIKLILWVVVLLVALQNLGVDITALITGLGIGGVAIALAVQNVLSDLFASLAIVLDKPFIVGDFITVGDLMGTVERVGLKTTRLRSLDGDQLVFSNSDLLKSRIRNYKRMYERRIVFTLGVTYETPYEKLAAIPKMIRDIIEMQNQVRFDRAHFKAYGDFSLNFEAAYYVLSPEYSVYMDLQQAINLALYKKFSEEGIDFAYPTQTLYISSQTGAQLLS